MIKNRIQLMAAALVVYWAVGGLACPDSAEDEIPYIDVNEASAPEKPVEERIQCLFGDAGPWKAAFSELQAAIASGDDNRLLALCAEPLRVNRREGPGLLLYPPALRERLDTLFDAKMRDIILRQQFAELFVNYQGLMIGDGEVWISAVGEDPDRNPFDQDAYAIRVISLNLMDPEE